MLSVGAAPWTEAQPDEAEAKVRLGRLLFFDPNLSLNRNQSCASCHDPQAGWAGGNDAINRSGSVYPGSIEGRFGNRAPPSVSYASFSPVFSLEDEGTGIPVFSGGNFRDGRATGVDTLTPVSDQASAPFINPLEMALPTLEAVVERVCAGAYRELLLEAWERPDLCEAGQESLAIRAIAYSIALFESSSEVNGFDSKYDRYLAGEADLTSLELRGLELFGNEANCATCHPVEPGPRGEPPLLTDFGYDNIGLPRNPENPWYDLLEFNPAGYDWVDQGLYARFEGRLEYLVFKDFFPQALGAFKAPSLRNLDSRPQAGFTRAYGHNGYFKSLEGVVRFYNTRDVWPTCANRFTPESEALQKQCWPEPEVPQNVNRDDMGNLGLSEEEEGALVAFLRTLSDGYRR